MNICSKLSGTKPVAQIMMLKQFAILLLLLVLVTSCGPAMSNGKTTILIRIENKASGMLVTSIVDAGRGELDLGYVIQDPDSTKIYANFPGTVNAPLNFRYQFENGSLQSATNLLHRGIRANEDITITVTDSGVSAKAKDDKN